MLVLSSIQGHPTTKWWSVITCVVNFVGASIHTVGYQCGWYYSLNESMMTYCLTGFFVVVQVPLNFGIVHIVLQKNAPGSLWWHMPLSFFLLRYGISQHYRHQEEHILSTQ